MASESVFAWIDRALQAGDAGAIFEQLVDRFRSDKQYGRIFEARLMKQRLDLGLPLVLAHPLDDLPQELRQPYQEAQLQAAREVGELFLADGDISRAWPYFRAIGDTRPIVQALERFELPESAADAQDLLSSTIHIAYQEAVHPRKGFELLLRHHGLCRALTMFNAYPGREGRDASLQLLVRALHGELVVNLKRAISAVEGHAPEGDALADLIAGRDWLFENDAHHTDTSHIVALLRLSGELDDKAALRLAVDIAEYASHLSPRFQHEDEPPFDRAYEDRGLYLKALLGQEVDRAVQHFERKVAALDPHRFGTRPAEILVYLLTRVGRYDDALTAFHRYLASAGPGELSCPSLVELCQMAGDFEQLKQVARDRADALTYMAALLQGGQQSKFSGEV